MAPLPNLGGTMPDKVLSVLFNFQYIRHLICAHYERTLINPHVLQINNHVKRFVEFQTSLFIYENGLYTLNKGKLHES